MIARIAVICLGLGLGISNPGIAQADTLTLQEGLSLISTKGYDLRIARAREAAAAKSFDLASAHKKPQVSAYADHTWLQNQPEAVFGGGTSPLGDDSFLRYGITVKQLVTDFGQTRSGIEAARAGARSQAEETGHIQNTAVLDYILSYVSLLKAEKALIIADLEVERFEAHVSDTQALHSAGEVTLNDVLSAEVALADARLRQITIRDERNLAASRLNFLLLRPLDDPTLVVDFPFLLDPVPDLEKISENSGSRRPDLKVLEEKIIQKEALLRASKAQSYPTLFVGGGYEYEENSYRVHEDNWSAMIGLNWDIYTGGAKTAAQKQITEELTALIAQREQVRELVNLQIRDYHRILTGTIERSAVTKKAVNQAEENLRLQRLRYAEGEATATEVTDAVTSLARTEDNHWSAKYSRLTAEAQLLYAAGEDLFATYSRLQATTPGAPRNTKTGERK